jgi:ribonuclease HII
VANEYILGIDESGRGPWAGPVVACGVILDPSRHISGLRDSKKLSEKAREILRKVILSQALLVVVKEIETQVIDQVNILQATLKAMGLVIEDAVKRMPITRILIDGNQLPSVKFNIEQKAIIKGDDLIPSIMAASIVAKTHRDGLMKSIDSLYPGYGFFAHKGYGTKEHREAIKRLGPCPEHRMSFSPLKDKIWL